MNKNTLVEIPIEDWPKLRDLYAVRKLESNSYSLIQNYINWLNKDPSLKESVKIYSLNGDWSDGTFILDDPNPCYIKPNTLADSQDRLLTALQCFHKKENLIFLGCPVRIQKTIKTYLTSLGIKEESYNFVPTNWNHIEMEKALEFNLDPPQGITLSGVRIEDVDLINYHWPHNFPGSEKFVDRLVRLSQNIGAYDENGNLVAWCLVLPLGGLGLLQVLDSHKRKGLGSLVVKAMAKMNAEKGLETMAPVLDGNIASQTMFERLGFRKIQEIFWFFRPSIE
ncbi:uncharacterized protein LOC129951846 [Eupeodes corollae]|uniref:uncharacterized protein LOC129951846 n=1 Tax=Eupeodes corollae TaxID=290404 RepID=UPI0024928807|nr:uncharacterized protein LOC129951846 [Eupeodes corollae]